MSRSTKKPRKKTGKNKENQFNSAQKTIELMWTEKSVGKKKRKCSEKDGGSLRDLSKKNVKRAKLSTPERREIKFVRKLEKMSKRFILNIPEAILKLELEICGDVLDDSLQNVPNISKLPKIIDKKGREQSRIKRQAKRDRKKINKLAVLFNDSAVVGASSSSTKSIQSSTKKNGFLKNSEKKLKYFITANSEDNSNDVECVGGFSANQNDGNLPNSYDVIAPPILRHQSTVAPFLESWQKATASIRQSLEPPDVEMTIETESENLSSFEAPKTIKIENFLTPSNEQNGNIWAEAATTMTIKQEEFRRAQKFEKF